ncbi:unnamed protein product [Amoebophrya sp. A120]|nr:unnamed protein product [Amoebophrya sp. A120]|eukprot:GSA120T00019705001.1
MAAAVAFIHSKNIVHFDLKPANFLMFENKQKIKLSDFGLAREVEQDKSHISRFGQCGTILYMAPDITSFQTQTFFDLIFGRLGLFSTR